MNLRVYIKKKYPITLTAFNNTLKAAGFSWETPVKNLTETQLQRLDLLLAEKASQLTNSQDIKAQLMRVAHYITLKHYKGYRFAFSLPVNGQRTSSNRKTARRIQGALMSKLDHYKKKR